MRENLATESVGQADDTPQELVTSHNIHQCKGADDKDLMKETHLRRSRVGSRWERARGLSRDPLHSKLRQMEEEDELPRLIRYVSLILPTSYYLTFRLTTQDQQPLFDRFQTVRT